MSHRGRPVVFVSSRIRTYLALKLPVNSDALAATRQREMVDAMCPFDRPNHRIFATPRQQEEFLQGFMAALGKRCNLAKV